MDLPDSELDLFYKNSTILITGGNGSEVKSSQSKDFKSNLY